MCGPRLTRTWVLIGARRPAVRLRRMTLGHSQRANSTMSGMGTGALAECFELLQFRHCFRHVTARFGRLVVGVGGFASRFGRELFCVTGALLEPRGVLVGLVCCCGQCS